ncbi:MAG: hypothetical protein PVG44_08570, partial [Desulfobacterales bacterium]
TVRTHGPNPFWIAPQEPYRDKGHKDDGYDSFQVNDKNFSFGRVSVVTAQTLKWIIPDYSGLSLYWRFISLKEKSIHFYISLTDVGSKSGLNLDSWSDI